MQLEEQIYTALTPSGLLTSAGDRIYPEVAPEDAALPRITYGRVSTTPQNGLGGHSGLDLVVMQLDMWAATRAQTLALDREVQALLSGKDFKALPTARYDSFEGSTHLYRRTVEYSMWDKTF